jgi:hypothetical protein
MCAVVNNVTFVDYWQLSEDGGRKSFHERVSLS